MCSPAARAAEQSESEAREHDAEIIAAANNWTVQDVLGMLEDSETFGALVEQVADAYPQDFSSGVSAASPSSSATLYFKGAVPAGVGQMIVATGLSINTVPSTGKNHVEWEQQVDGLTDFLEQQNVEQFLVAFDSVSTVEVTIGGGAPAPVLPQNLASNVTVTLISGSMYEPHGDVLGGSQMRLADQLPECTSSWNVKRTIDGVTTYGTVTAGHCTDIASVDDVYDIPQATTVKWAHIGGSGDLKWYTVANSLPPFFWADTTEWRAVLNVKTSWRRNEWSCVFGRTTAVRICDQVFRTSVSFPWNGHVLRRMVAMTGNNAQGGDSGGGWSLGRSAHGVHGGETPVAGARRDVFSRAERLPKALNVEVRIAP